MELHLFDIPEEGMTINIDSRDKNWFRSALFSALSTTDDGVTGSLNVTILRMEEDISIIGELKYTLMTSCDRCLVEYSANVQMNLNLLFIPYSKKEDDEDDSSGDMEILHYDGDKIHLNKIVEEQVVLHKPLKFLCNEGCKGLCSQCGNDLNKAKCKCKVNKVDPKLSALRGLKDKGNRA